MLEMKRFFTPFVVKYSRISSPFLLLVDVSCNVKGWYTLVKKRVGNPTFQCRGVIFFPRGERSEKNQRKNEVPYSWESFNALFEVFFFHFFLLQIYTHPRIDALFFSSFPHPLYPVLIINSFRLRVIYVEIDSM